MYADFEREAAFLVGVVRGEMNIPSGVKDNWQRQLCYDLDRQVATLCGAVTTIQDLEAERPYVLTLIDECIITVSTLDRTNPKGELSSLTHSMDYHLRDMQNFIEREWEPPDSGEPGDAV
jgi:hypothetical protein